MLHAGRASTTVAVRPIDDSAAEPDEKVILTLSPNLGYTVGARDTATVTIHSNE